jgi:YesN/AraC family two-component response regulator
MSKKTNQRVLIVDDEKSIQELFGKALIKHGHNAEVAENGRLGFRMATTFDYDTIIFDLHMPEWNGVDAIKGILLIKPKCRFIVVSAYADRKIADSLRAIPEVLALLSKPADIFEILSYVESN